jgi:prephenate dehydratase
MIGVQGEAGSYSDAALRALRGAHAPAAYYPDFESVVSALAEGEVDRALLPVYNSLAGPVAASLRAIARSDLRVEAETELPIRLCVLGLPGSSLQQLESAASHPVALRQCTRFFAHHPWIRAESEYDTAGAARLVAERRNPAAAALASREAGDRYGLVVLAEDVQDRADNMTRFWLLARRRLHPAADATAAGIEAHLAAYLPGRTVAAIRGATTLDSDDREALHQATAELLGSLLDANGLTPADVVSAIFTATPDVTCDFPAVAARAAGWKDVPLLCTSEMAVAGGLPRCLRVLLHVHGRNGGWQPRHVYLRDARALRPDLTKPPPDPRAR